MEGCILLRLFKEKLAWGAPIAVILIIALFSVNLFAQGNPQVRNLPVALIINDEGEHVEAVKLAIEQMTVGTVNAEPVLAFTNEKESDIDTLFANKAYYAALLIPENYNETLQNVFTNSEPATLHIYINEGFNVTGSNIAKTTLHELIAQLSEQYSNKLLTELGDSQINAAQANVLVNPIVSSEKIFNAITPATANGSAPTLLAVPAWVGALIGGFIVFLATTNIYKQEMLSRKQSLRLMGDQLLFGVIIALFSGFTVTTLAQIANVNLPSYFLIGFFISFAAFCFYLLVIGVTSWIGKPAITLFMVVMLLGMGVLMTPPEMLPNFFVNFIRPWIPIRFASEGLREIFYFGSGFYTGSSFNTILGIGSVGLIIFILSIFRPIHAK